MASIFESFQAGFQGGQEQARERRRTLATAMAGRKMAAGDTRGAQAALTGEGMWDEAAAAGDLGEQNRKEDIRRQLQGALVNLGPDANRQQRLEAQRGVYEQAGEVDQANALDAQLSQLDDAQRQKAAEALDFLGSQALGLVEGGVPVEQRQQRAIQMLQGTPYDSPEARAKIMAQTDWSDATVMASAKNALSLSERLAAGERAQERTYRQERDAVGDRQWQQSFQQQEREMRMRSEERQEARADRQQVKIGTARTVRNDYERALRPINELRDNLSLISDYAASVTPSGVDGGVDKDTVRVNDGAMLMIAARMVQGAGILSDQDVNTVKGAGLDGFIANAAGYVSGNQQLSARQRHALASLIMSKRDKLEESARDVYEDHAAFAREQGIDPDSVGIRIPAYLRRRDATAAANAPAVGTVTNGYRFKGGNPNDRASWEPAGNGASGVPAQSPGRVVIR